MRKLTQRKVIAKMATQQDIVAGIEIAGAAIVDVEWLDACAHMNVEKIHTEKLAELLCPTRTTGRIVAHDNKVMCIATNISSANGADIIAIPITWIEKMKIIEEK